MPVLAVLSGVLWVAVVISMVAFADKAEEIDEGVNLHALLLAMLAMAFTIATVALASRRPEREKSLDSPDREPAA